MINTQITALQLLDLGCTYKEVEWALNISSKTIAKIRREAFFLDKVIEGMYEQA